MPKTPPKKSSRHKTEIEVKAREGTRRVPKDVEVSVLREALEGIKKGIDNLLKILPSAGIVTVKTLAAPPTTHYPPGQCDEPPLRAVPRYPPGYCDEPPDGPPQTIEEIVRFLQEMSGLVRALGKTTKPGTRG